MYILYGVIVSTIIYLIAFPQYLPEPKYKYSEDKFIRKVFEYWD